MSEMNEHHLSDDEIEVAKSSYKGQEIANHEHNDCIRIAYEWLDAQLKLKAPNRKLLIPMKHIIESWAKRYVSESDVVVAASLHNEIMGSYPTYNISMRLIRPKKERLSLISQAGIHETYNRYDDFEMYKKNEV